MAKWYESLGDGLLTALPVVGQFFQSQMEADQQRQNTDRTIAANKQLAEYQYSKDLEMWNRGNAYNSPEAQMDRLKKAGLNPNLVYGSGAVGNSASQLPKYQAPTVDYNYKVPVDLPAMLSAFQDFQVKQAQTDNLRAQRSAIEQSTRLNSQRTLLAANELSFRDQSLPYRVLSEWQKEGILDQKRKAFDLLFPHQLDLLKGRVGAQEKATERVVEQTRHQQLINDWYLAKLFGDLGLGLLGKVGNLFPTTKAAKSLPSLNQKKQKPLSDVDWSSPSRLNELLRHSR